MGHILYIFFLLIWNSLKIEKKINSFQFKVMNIFCSSNNVFSRFKLKHFDIYIEVFIILRKKIVTTVLCSLSSVQRAVEKVDQEGHV